MGLHDVGGGIKRIETAERFPYGDIGEARIKGESGNKNLIHPRIELGAFCGPLSQSELKHC